MAKFSEPLSFRSDKIGVPRRRYSKRLGSTGEKEMDVDDLNKACQTFLHRFPELCNWMTKSEPYLFGHLCRKGYKNGLLCSSWFPHKESNLHSAISSLLLLDIFDPSPQPEVWDDEVFRLWCIELTKLWLEYSPSSYCSNAAPILNIQSRVWWFNDFVAECRRRVSGDPKFIELNCSLI